MSERVGQSLSPDVVDLVAKQRIERFLLTLNNHTEFDGSFVRIVGVEFLLNSGERLL
jgi:hypothetical protein